VLYSIVPTATLPRLRLGGYPLLARKLRVLRLLFFESVDRKSAVPKRAEWRQL